MDYNSGSRLPRTLKLIVHDGKNLEYRVPQSKSTAETRRWRVIFIGGEKKQASASVEAQDGSPLWDCEVTMCPPKPIDSIIMRIIDGKERHVGQVILPLSKVIQTTAPPLVASKLQSLPLTATKRNSYPCGQISFWVWVESFWPLGTEPVALTSRRRSIRGSISNLGLGNRARSLLGVQRVEDEKKNSKSSNLRKLKRGNPDKANISETGVNPSIISSIMATNDPRPDSVLSGWPSNLNGSRAGSSLGHRLGGASSYNPFASSDDEEISPNPQTGGRKYIANGRSTPFSAAKSRSASVWTLGGAATNDTFDGQKHDSSNGRPKKLLNKIKSKLSNSTANLAMKPKTTLQTSFRHSSDESLHDKARKTRRPAPPVPIRPNIITDHNPTMLPNTDTHKQRASPIDSDICFGRTSLDTSYMAASALKSQTLGVYPEEYQNKAFADMTKRELIEHTTLLEKALKGAHSDVVKLGMKNQQLCSDLESVELELEQTRERLTDLRSRLLEDNMTQYLEVENDSSSIPRSALNQPSSQDFCSFTKFHPFTA